MSQELERQVIDRARALICEPKHWRQMVYAMDDHHRRVDWCSQEAVAFCVIGALRRAAYDLSGDRNRAILIANRIAAKMTTIGFDELARIKVQHINDTKGHGEVLRLFSAAKNTS